MTLEFSDKYQLLFEILDGKHPTVDTVLMYGGRESGKSYAESVFIPIAVNDYNHRVLYTRYTMNATDQSISEALKDRMELLGITHNFEYANNVYQHKKHSGKIFITGQKTSSLNQTAKLKSLENFSMFVTDEADEIKSYADWDSIRKSIRAKDVQCLNLIVFNPPTTEHWINQEFFEAKGVKEGFTGVVDNVMYIHTTYKDNIENIAEHNLRDYLRLEESYNIYESTPTYERSTLSDKIKKEHRYYKHVVLGGFLPNAEFDTSLPFVSGMDFGSRDPDTNIKVAVDKRKKIIYCDEILYQNGLGTIELGNKLKELVVPNAIILADFGGGGTRTIHDLYDMGLNILRCSKSGKKIEWIKMMQDYKFVITHNSKNTAKALNNYAWKNKGAELPDHEFSHIPDAIEYAFKELVR